MNINNFNYSRHQLQKMILSNFLQNDPDVVIIPYTSKNPLYVVSFILSGIGIIYIILTLFLLKLLSNPWSRMVLFISLCDVIITGGIVILYSIEQPNETICDSFIWATHYAVLASFSWGACFAHAFMTVVKTEDETRVSGNLKYYIAISHIIPIPLTILSIKTDFVRYNPEKNFCYHEFRYGEIDVSFFWTEIVPYAIALGFAIYYTCSALKKLYAVTHGISRWRLMSVLQFPLIMVICWFGQQLNIFLAQFNVHLPYAQNIGVAFQTMCFLQGFLNAIAYGVTYTVYSGYKKLFKKHCKRKRREIIEESTRSLVHSSDEEIIRALMERSYTRKLSPKSTSFRKASSFRMVQTLDSRSREDDIE